MTTITDERRDRAPAAETPAPETSKAEKPAKKPAADAAGQEPEGEFARLPQQIVARSAVSGGGLIGGVGLKARDMDLLHRALEADEESLIAVVRQRLRDSLATAKITTGIDEEEVEATVRDFVEHVRNEDTSPVAHKVAAGEPPEKGEDGRVEYLLNTRGRPFAELAGLESGSNRTLAHVVNAGDLLARLLPARMPTSGTAVTGDEITVDQKPSVASLDGVAGDNTECDGSSVRSACDGLCIEDASGWLRVVPEIVVDQVDATTGRVPESGISGSNVAVRGSIKGETGVATTETLFVGEGAEGGGVDGLAPVQAKHVVVNGPLSGASGTDAPVEAAEFCVVRDIVSRRVSGRRVLVVDGSHLGRIEAETGIWIDGNVRGGVLTCPGQTVVCGDMGTPDGGSNTVVRFNGGSAQARRERRVAAAKRRLQTERDEVQGQLDALAEESETRAKADPYWARMVEGDAPPPQGVIQAKVQQIFVEHGEKRQRAERRLAALSRSLQQVSRQDEEEGEETDASAACLVVGGSIYLDVSFEMTCQMEGDDAELEVNFAHDGQRFRNHKLSDVRRLLTEKASAYMEKQNASLEERKAAIDQMFEGQEKKPTAPKAENKTFEIELRWAKVDADPALEVTAVARLSTEDPKSMHITNRARLHEVKSSSQVVLKVEGARALFEFIDLETAPGGWMADPEVQQQLSGICAAGVNANELIHGKGTFVARTTTEEAAT